MISALRSRDFRLLWISQSISVIGDGLVIVAVGLFVTRLTGDPSDVGLVLTAYVLPLVLLLLVGGVVADRLPRQALMVASDCARCVLHGTLALLIAFGEVRISYMVVIGLLYGSAQAFFQPAYTGLVPQTVPEGEIQSAQALGGISRELAAFVSPAIATALIFSVGGAAAFGVDAATFAVSALLLSRVRARDRGGEHVSDTLLRELKEGWLAVSARPWVWASIAAFSASLLVAFAPFLVLGPTVSREVYGTEAVFGIASAFWGVGTVLGAVMGARWRPRRPMFTAVLWPSPGRPRSRSSPWDRRSASCTPPPCSPGSASGCSVSGGRPRSRNGSRRSCCRESRRGTGWARWLCSRWATCSPDRSPTRSAPSASSRSAACSVRRS